MTAKGYATNTQVGLTLGVTLTAGQQAVADEYIEAAENWIDGQVWHPWLVTSPIADELHSVALSGEAIPSLADLNRLGTWRSQATGLYLKHTPVTAITSLKVRLLLVGATDLTLTAAKDYELLDATRGLVLIRGYDGYLAKVTYTVTLLVPKEINLATRLLVAHWLNTSGALHPERAGVSAITVGQGDLSLKFADAAAFPQAGVPPEVTRLLGAHKRLVFA